MDSYKKHSLKVILLKYGVPGARHYSENVMTGIFFPGQNEKLGGVNVNILICNATDSVTGVHVRALCGTTVRAL